MEIFFKDNISNSNLANSLFAERKSFSSDSENRTTQHFSEKLQSSIDNEKESYSYSEKKVFNKNTDNQNTLSNKKEHTKFKDDPAFDSSGKSKDISDDKLKNEKDELKKKAGKLKEILEDLEDITGSVQAVQNIIPVYTENSNEISNIESSNDKNVISSIEAFKKDLSETIEFLTGVTELIESALRGDKEEQLQIMQSLSTLIDKIVNKDQQDANKTASFSLNLAKVDKTELSPNISVSDLVKALESISEKVEHMEKPINNDALQSIQQSLKSIIDQQFFDEKSSSQGSSFGLNEMFSELEVLDFSVGIDEGISSTALDKNKELLKTDLSALSDLVDKIKDSLSESINKIEETVSKAAVSSEVLKEQTSLLKNNEVVSINNLSAGHEQKVLSDLNKTKESKISETSKGMNDKQESDINSLPQKAEVTLEPNSEEDTANFFKAHLKSQVQEKRPVQSGVSGQATQVSGDTQKLSEELLSSEFEIEENNADKKSSFNWQKASVSSEFSIEGASSKTHKDTSAKSQKAVVADNQPELVQGSGKIETSSASSQINESGKAFSRPGEYRNVMDQVLEKMNLKSADTKTSISMSLKPANLGQVDFELVFKDGSVVAKFVTESNQVKQILESGFEELQTALEDQGVEISGLEVSVGQDNNQETASEELFNSFSEIKGAALEKDVPEEKNFVPYEFENHSGNLNLVA